MDFKDYSKLRMQELFGFYPYEPVTFYTQHSAIFFELTSKLRSFRIGIAKCKDSNRRGRPNKGESIFEHKNKPFFTLTVSQCLKIIEAIPLLLKNEYVNPKPFNDKQKDQLVLTNFREINGRKTPSNMVVRKNKDGQGNDTISISIFPPKESGDYSAEYILQNEAGELRRFMFLLENICKNLDFIRILENAKIKTTRQRLFENKNLKFDDKYKPSESMDDIPPPDNNNTDDLPFVDSSNNGVSANNTNGDIFETTLSDIELPW